MIKVAPGVTFKEGLSVKEGGVFIPKTVFLIIVKIKNTFFLSSFYRLILESQLIPILI